MRAGCLAAAQRRRRTAAGLAGRAARDRYCSCAAAHRTAAALTGHRRCSWVLGQAAVVCPFVSATGSHHVLLALLSGIHVLCAVVGQGMRLQPPWQPAPCPRPAAWLPAPGQQACWLLCALGMVLRMGRQTHPATNTVRHWHAPVRSGSHCTPPPASTPHAPLKQQSSVLGAVFR